MALWRETSRAARQCETEDEDRRALRSSRGISTGEEGAVKARFSSLSNVHNQVGFSPQRDKRNMRLKGNCRAGRARNKAGGRMRDAKEEMCRDDAGAPRRGRSLRRVLPVCYSSASSSGGACYAASLRGVGAQRRSFSVERVLLNQRREELERLAVERPGGDLLSMPELSHDASRGRRSSFPASFSFFEVETAAAIASGAGLNEALGKEARRSRAPCKARHVCSRFRLASPSSFLACRPHGGSEGAGLTSQLVCATDARKVKSSLSKFLFLPDVAGVETSSAFEKCVGERWRARGARKSASSSRFFLCLAAAAVVCVVLSLLLLRHRPSNPLLLLTRAAPFHEISTHWVTRFFLSSFSSLLVLLGVSSPPSILSGLRLPASKAAGRGLTRVGSAAGASPEWSSSPLTVSSLGLEATEEGEEGLASLFADDAEEAAFIEGLTAEELREFLRAEGWSEVPNVRERVLVLPDALPPLPRAGGGLFLRRHHHDFDGPPSPARPAVAASAVEAGRKLLTAPVYEEAKAVLAQAVREGHLTRAVRMHGHFLYPWPMFSAVEREILRLTADQVRWFPKWIKNHRHAQRIEQSVLDAFLPVVAPQFTDKYGGPGPARSSSASGGLAGEQSPGIRFTWLGHATALVNVDGLNILIDPMFDADLIGPYSEWLRSVMKYISALCGSLGERHRVPPCTYGSLPEVDVVLLSHNHPDHIMEHDVHAICTEHAKKFARTVWYVPEGVTAFLRQQGCASASIFEFTWGETRTISCHWRRGRRVCSDGMWSKRHVRSETYKITFTAGVHWAGRSPSKVDHNTSLWGGFAVAGPTHKFYYGGDTAYWRKDFDEYKKIGEILGPFHLAALPIGAYEPNEDLRYQHVKPSESLQMFRDVRAEVAVGVHWGTLRLSAEEFFDPMLDLECALLGVSEADCRRSAELRHRYVAAHALLTQLPKDLRAKHLVLGGNSDKRPAEQAAGAEEDFSLDDAVFALVDEDRRDGKAAGEEWMNQDNTLRVRNALERGLESTLLSSRSGSASVELYGTPWRSPTISARSVSAAKKDTVRGGTARVSSALEGGAAKGDSKKRGGERVEDASHLHDDDEFFDQENPWFAVVTSPGDAAELSVSSSEPAGSLTSLPPGAERGEEAEEGEWRSKTSQISEGRRGDKRGEPGAESKRSSARVEPLQAVARLGMLPSVPEQARMLAALLTKLERMMAPLSHPHRHASNIQRLLRSMKLQDAGILPDNDEWKMNLLTEAARFQTLFVGQSMQVEAIDGGHIRMTRSSGLQHVWPEAPEELYAFPSRFFASDGRSKRAHRLPEEADDGVTGPAWRGPRRDRSASGSGFDDVGLLI
ncbi:hypothetical protein BESB_043400 [Besnoitia besnoiti]|uniref:Metallo-beta-lactamase domain-containing protein n=1 Tax=Besnoitia besnoiti TaxID=94643 RepID=A0A2A9MCD4_BESBE|nr:hypothetical protein BESB_043400 [Besnoitia besnoiti]PFH36148.1 hypothetical protein BESB_043400 [Besnoitia besnoiti]